MAQWSLPGPRQCAAPAPVARGGCGFVPGPDPREAGC